MIDEAQRQRDLLHLAARWDARADAALEQVGPMTTERVAEWMRWRAMAAHARGGKLELVDAVAELVERGIIKP